MGLLKNPKGILGGIPAGLLGKSPGWKTGGILEIITWEFIQKCQDRPQQEFPKEK